MVARNLAKVKCENVKLKLEEGIRVLNKAENSAGCIFCNEITSPPPQASFC